jgi:hypothetical protein
MDPASDWVVSGGKGALDFDGSNDFVVATIPPLFGQVTLSAWVRGIPGSSNTNYIVSCPVATGGSNGIDFLNPTNAQANISLNGNFVSLNSNVDLRGSWNHLACGYDGTRAFFFINGVQVGSTNWGNGLNTLTAREINLGRFGSFGSHSPVQLDDVTIYNAGLTANEVREIYRLGRGYGVFPESDFDEGFAAAAGFKAYWARRQSQLIGGGV